MSRGVPYRWRRGPAARVARMPPSVEAAPPTPSSIKRWRCVVSPVTAACKAASGVPACATSVMSPGWRSTMPASAAVDRIASQRVGVGRQLVFVPPPRTTRARPVFEAASSNVETSAASRGVSTGMPCSSDTRSAPRMPASSATTCAPRDPQSRPDVRDRSQALRRTGAALAGACRGCRVRLGRRPTARGRRRSGRHP